MELSPNNATDAWLHLLRKIWFEGSREQIRDVLTLEVLNNTVTFNMNNPIIIHEGRDMNYKFLGAECYFICNGDNRAENLIQYNSNVAQFSDDGLIFNGHYGAPFNNQLNYVVNNLVNDPTSRQAVMTIWKQNPIKSRDIRCTLSLQFMVRGNHLHTFVNMRSSDIIWGVCYDFTVFTFMTLRVLTMVNESRSLGSGSTLKLGNMYFNAASSHLYERHFDLAQSLVESTEDDYYGNWFLPSEVKESWSEAVMFMQKLITDGAKAL